MSDIMPKSDKQSILAKNKLDNKIDNKTKGVLAESVSAKNKLDKSILANKKIRNKKQYAEGLSQRQHYTNKDKADLFIEHWHCDFDDELRLFLKNGMTNRRWVKVYSITNDVLNKTVGISLIALLESYIAKLDKRPNIKPNPNSDYDVSRMIWIGIIRHAFQFLKNIYPDTILSSQSLDTQTPSNQVPSNQTINGDLSYGNPTDNDLDLIRMIPNGNLQASAKQCIDARIHTMRGNAPIPLRESRSCVYIVDVIARVLSDIKRKTVSPLDVYIDFLSFLDTPEYLPIGTEINDIKYMLCDRFAEAFGIVLYDDASRVAHSMAWYLSIKQVREIRHDERDNQIKQQLYRAFGLKDDMPKDDMPSEDITNDDVNDNEKEECV